MALDSASPMTAPRRMGGWAAFAGISAGLIASSAFALMMFFRGEGDVRAIWISAAVAFVSQVGAFPAVRRLARKNLVVGWAAGSLVRFGTLGLYALAATLWLHLPMTPALLSLALFYFLSMVIEPLFLRS